MNNYLAAELRLIYCRKRSAWTRLHQGREEEVGRGPVPSWDGGTDAWGRTYQPVWPRMAELVTREQADPERFLEAQFLERKHPPTPSQCSGPAAVAAYRKLQQEQMLRNDLVKLLGLEAERLEYELAVRRPLLHQGWTETELLALVLTDPSVEMSALFRYSIAHRAGLKTTAALLRPLAMKQFAPRSGEYRQHWAGVLPAELDAALAPAPVRRAASPTPRPGDDVGYRPVIV